jgi:hypothetical protein
MAFVLAALLVACAAIVAVRSTRAGAKTAA